MAKVTYDVTDEDGSKNAGRQQYETPPVGVYPAKITKCIAEAPENKNPRLHVVVEITKPTKNNYPPLHEYITFTDASKWKFDQFVQAIGIATATSKRKGEFDDTKQVGKSIQVYLTHETDSYIPDGKTEPITRTRARIANFLPKDGKAAAANGKAAAAEEPEEEELDLDTLGAAADEGDEDAIAALTDQAETAGIDPEEYETWVEVAELLAGAPEAGEDEEDTDLGTLVEAADEGDEEAVAQLEEYAVENDTIDPEEYETWTEWLAAMQEGVTGGAEETPDYESMSTLALKKLAKEREIPTGGTKEELVERLTEFDETDPFSG